MEQNPSSAFFSSTNKWPEDWKNQEFFLIHKNGSAKRSLWNGRKLAFISHTSNILLLINLNRFKKKIESG